MKALSIRQPWAWLILHAGKDIENRDWQTTFRGRILIHAGKGMTVTEFADAMDFYEDRILDRKLWAMPKIDELARGALVGSVEVVGMTAQSDSPWFFGTYGWQLRNPIAFKKPIPWKGALGLFEVPDHVVEGHAP